MFGLPGARIYPLVDALGQRADRITTYFGFPVLAPRTYVSEASRARSASASRPRSASRRPIRIGRRFGHRIVGARLHDPDSAALARLFGVEAHRVGTPDALRPVLAAALRAEGPVLIHIPIAQGSEASPRPFIHPAP